MLPCSLSCCMHPPGVRSHFMPDAVTRINHFQACDWSIVTNPVLSLVETETRSPLTNSGALGYLLCKGLVTSVPQFLIFAVLDRWCELRGVPSIAATLVFLLRLFCHCHQPCIEKRKLLQYSSKELSCYRNFFDQQFFSLHGEVNTISVKLAINNKLHYRVKKIHIFKQNRIQ